MQGTITQDIRLLGTSMRLNKGQRVILTPADNLPADSKVEYYAYPADGVWGDGQDTGLPTGPTNTFPINYGDAEPDTDYPDAANVETAMFERFELQMTRDQADSVSRPGQDASEAVAVVIDDNRIIRQLYRIGPDAIRDELREYGAWDDEQLADNAANSERIVWVAGCNIREELAADSQ